MTKLLEQYLTETELAKELGKCSRTLASWRQQRSGPAWTSIGKTIVYSRDAVMAWLQSQQQQPVRNRRTA